MAFGFLRNAAVLFLVLFSLSILVRSQSDLQPSPSGVMINQVQLARIDDAVNAAIKAGDLPGAVVLVWHQGETVYEKAFGRRAVSPHSEQMTVDTIFDLASLTKVVVTTTAVMMLVEEGRLRLRNPVARYLPGFERNDKNNITVEHLLTHLSGLRADLTLEEEFDGYEIAITRAFEEKLTAEPGTRFIYSDINFLILGEIVTRISGMTLDEFAAQRIFKPLGMRDSMFTPPAILFPRIAPTQECAIWSWPCGGRGATMLRGMVHDPTARRMGGVAGHAGMFGTASDLARFGAMVLSAGKFNNESILAPLTIERMTSRATPSYVRDVRGLGWDIDSRYSANRGDLFPIDSFGHTGFTGTSVWFDPSSQTCVVFLSSRLHPDGNGNVTELRGMVATLAAAAITTESKRRNVTVGTGIDVLRAEDFIRLRGAKIALLTNHTGRARDGVTTVELLWAAPEVDLKVLLSPEHGFGGHSDEFVPDAREPSTGLPIYSLYGPTTRRPTAAMLAGIDTIVVDLQDAGTRFYTYPATMAYVMEMASTHGLRVVVLDRPNPITGNGVEGPMLDDDAIGFTGYVSMPVRHGLTIGELARFFNDERDIGVELDIVKLKGWQRDFWFDETGLPWIAPSPNLRTVTQALLYPGIGSIESTNLSVGRGTNTPFERLGAPWVEATRLSVLLNARELPGVRFYPAPFTPSASKYSGESCHGIHIVVTNREILRPVHVGLEIAAALHQIHGDRFEIDRASRLFGSREDLQRIRAGEDPAVLAEGWVAGESEWRSSRKPYLLY
jgi:uncharacterized protein YbbC (DUF1343 family)/CubicO group peptidase (beta-lactamase class C family)